MNISIFRNAANLVLGKIAIFCLLVVAGLTAGCSPGPDNYSRYLESLPVVVSGSAAWGSVNLRLASPDVVVGRTPWGSNELKKNGNNYSGSTPWGKANVSLNDGRLTGQLPWGKLDVTVTDTTLDGSAPWGKVHLVLNGRNITGSTPWGRANLVLGEGYHSLRDPAVLAALVAIIADEGNSN